MARDKSEILNDLATGVVEMNEDLVIEVSREAIEAGVDAYEAITSGLAKGMDKANELFEEEEYFVPELLICADAMYGGIEILKPYLPKEQLATRKKAVIGVMKGDTHDIGKNLVRIMLDNAGFEIHDVGRDVPYEKFIDTAGKIQANLVCMSTLMTTTMDGMGIVIEDLKKAGLSPMTMVGGGPISPGFAKDIGADGYARNAAEAVRVAKGLFQRIPFNIKAQVSKEYAYLENNRGGER